MEKKITLKRYACTVLILFLLLFPDSRQGIGGISLRVWLVYLAAAAGGVLWILGIRRGEKYRKIEALDCLAGIFLVWNLFLVVIRSFSGENLEGALFAAALMGFYLLFSMQVPRFPVYRLMALCSVFPIVGLLWHFLLDENFTFGIGLLLQEEGGAVPLLLLLAMGSAAGYILGDAVLPSWIYLVIAAADFLTLFFTQNIPGVILGFGGLTVLLLYTGTAKERLIRGLHLLLLYLLLLSNMPLLAVLWKKEFVYSMEGGVYLEWVTALACALVFFLVGQTYRRTGTKMGGSCPDMRETCCSCRSTAFPDAPVRGKACGYGRCGGKAGGFFRRRDTGLVQGSRGDFPGYAYRLRDGRSDIAACGNIFDSGETKRIAKKRKRMAVCRCHSLYRAVLRFSTAEGGGTCFYLSCGCRVL